MAINNTVENINNQPTIEPQTVTGIFTKYIAKTLPLAFDESMSYYECLCALLEYLNEDIVPDINNVNSGLSELQTFYEDLQDYVNDYFDSLDVQQEINNKLDDMAEDGSLTELIEAYVNPYINTQNQAIESIHNEVISLASGSPKGVYSTVSALETANPNTGVYIVTADGHIYSWTKDGVSAVDLGVYQATLLGDNEIKFNNLDTIIQNFFNDNAYNQVQTLTYEDGFYNNNTIGSTISKTTSTSIECSVINVQPGEIYYIYGWSESSARSWAIGDVDNKNILRETTNQYHLAKVIIPYNGRKLFINHWKNKKDTIVTKTTQLGLNQNDMLKLQNNFLKMCSESRCITLKGLTTGIDSNRSYGRWIAITIPNTENLINTNDKLKISFDVYNEDISKITYCDIWLRQTGNTLYQANPFSLLAINNKNKLAITKLNDKMIHFECELAYPTCEENYKEILFTPSIASSNANYVCKVTNINFYNTTTSEAINIFDYVRNYSANIIDEYFNFVLDEENIVSYLPSNGFSKWFAIGDSITEKNFRAATNYIDYCVQDMKYITNTNLGASGKGYMNGLATSTNFVSKISQLSGYDPETDIITIMGSINDGSYATGDNLGSIGDTTNSTLYGNMYIFFDTLFTAHPQARVGIISPIPWKLSNSTQKTKKDNIVKALQETAEYFNIPFLNISDMANLRPWNETFLTECYTSDNPTESHPDPEVDTDGIHPNSDGHRLFYKRIEEFIKTL